MRKLVRALSALLSLVAAPAVAQEVIPREVPVPYHWVTDSEASEIEETAIPGRWYVGGEFGAMIVEDADVDTATTDNIITLDHEYGYDGGFFVGHDFGGFRLEAEVAYKKADLSGFLNSVALPGEGTVFPGGRDFAGGSTSALSFMLNGMLDFGDEENVGAVSGFVGGGVGLARVKFNNQRVFANSTPFLDDSDSRLAWQLFAGVRQRISDRIDVTVKYRFFNVPDLRVVAVTGGFANVQQEVETRFRSHSLLGGLTFRFGGGTRATKICRPGGERIAVDAPCPPVRHCVQGGDPNTPDPTCQDRKRCTADGPVVELTFVCPPVACGPDDIRNPEGKCGPYMIFFGWDKHLLGEKGRGDTLSDQEKIDATLASQLPVLERALQFYRDQGTVEVMIVGHADRSGPDLYNEGLSCDRAKTVEKWFTDRDVVPGVIGMEWRGERDPLVDTADGVREVQNRRVVITFGPHPSAPPPARCPARR
jgi:OmpA-OmpF porin, OOP family